MNQKEITRLKMIGKTNDEIYELAICSYSLFGQAFFGFKSSKNEKQKMNRLWLRILNIKSQTGVPDAKISPEGTGNKIMDINDWKIIASYTRAEAVADGVQVPVNPGFAKEAGIIFPVFLTRTVYDKYVPVPEKMEDQSEDGRLWDILHMFSLEARGCNGNELKFQFWSLLPDKGDWNRYEKVCDGNRLVREVTLRAVIGPLDLDDPSPAITIMFPNED